MMKPLWTSLVLIGCSSPTSKGTAFIRLTELNGSCTSTTATGATGIDQFAGLPYRRVHAAAAFEGGSQFPGGAVVALGWRDDDGTIGRVQIDVGADRGYGISAFPDAAPGPMPTDGAWPAFSQAFSYVTWQGGQRTFAAQRVWGILNFIPDLTTNDPAVGMSDASGPWNPLTMFAHVAVDGIGADGAPLCHVIAVHAAEDEDRTDAYDPSWFALSASALVIDGASPPSYAGDVALTANVIAPGSTSSDPGGDPPRLERNAQPFAPGYPTGGGGDDGSGDCD